MCIGAVCNTMCPMILVRLLLLLLCIAGTLPGDELTSATLPGLKAMIGPDEEEQNWLKIPWETDLETALTKARQEGRPVFLWEMDGHPLGCT